jgi:KTSC domain
MSDMVFATRSSIIHRVAYNENENRLEIEFRSGNVYGYYNVPERMWKIFRLYIESEGSAGTFFNEYIKDHFRSEKLKED